MKTQPIEWVAILFVPTAALAGLIGDHGFAKWSWGEWMLFGLTCLVVGQWAIPRLRRVRDRRSSAE